MLRRSAAVVGLAAAILTTGLVAGSHGVAAPPSDADPALHGWFESLKQPGSGASCCSIADCRPVDYRLATGGYEAYLDAVWQRVPADRVLHRTANPIGRGVLCRSPISGAILCFVPANEI